MAQGGGGGGPITITTASKYALVAGGDLSLISEDDIPDIPGQGEQVSQADAQMKVAPVGSDASADVLLIDRATGATVTNLGTVTVPDGTRESATLFFTPTTVLASQALTLGNLTWGSSTPGKTMTVVVKKAS